MREQLKVNPEEKASICNKAFFLWTFPIYNQLRSKGEALELSDLAPLPKDEDPKLLVKKLKAIIANNTVDGVCQINMGTAIWKLIHSDMKKAFFLINVAVLTYVMIPFCLATIVEVMLVQLAVELEEFVHRHHHKIYAIVFEHSAHLI